MNPSHGVFWTTVAPANLLDWQVQAKSFEAIAGYRWQTVDLTGGDRSERLRGLRITPEFFKVLNVPLMGATFHPADAQRHWWIPKGRPEIILGRGSFQYLAFKAAGHESVKVYVGSWDEWGNDASLPLAAAP